MGNKQLGIRWIPAKNGKEGLKWVPSCMQDIVVEAVRRLTNISSLARKAAKFAEENPNILMLFDKRSCNIPFFIQKAFGLKVK
ncbi:hypothetical protein MZB01_00880 [Haemophilus influenzae]